MCDCEVLLCWALALVFCGCGLVARCAVGVHVHGVGLHTVCIVNGIRLYIIASCPSVGRVLCCEKPHSFCFTRRA